MTIVQDHSTSGQRRARQWADPHLAWALADETESLWDQLGAEASELTGLSRDLAEAQAAIATKDAAIADLQTRLAESEEARAEWERRAIATAIGVQPVTLEPPPDDGPFHHAIWDEATETEQPKEPPPIVDAAGGSDDFEQPTMNCPRCGKEYHDFDGVGVIYCAPPEGCGFCRHVARGGTPEGMTCEFCGDVEP